MKKDNKKSKSPVVLILYAVSIMFGIYTIFTIYSSYTYISSLVSQGLVISDELGSVISYFVGASSPYLFYSISVWAIGYIISKLNSITCEMKRYNNEEIKEEIIIADSNEVIVEAVEDEAIVTELSEDTEQIKEEM